MFETKKLALLRILEIYKKYSDCNHPLKQDEIIAHLYCDYGIEMERKAVGRNVALLREAGVEIRNGRNGSYLESRPFEDAELKLLIDGVLSSKHITVSHSNELIQKLCSMSNIYFRSYVKNIYSVNDWGKTENCTLFYNIDIVNEAIECNRQVRFDYNKYGIDKELHKSSVHTVSPYQFILKNQRYYLMAFEEKHKELVFYRVDRITNIEITENVAIDLKTIDGYRNGVDYRIFSSSLPYMYSDKAEHVEFMADKRIIDQIVDWFGYESDITDLDERQVKVRVLVSLSAMEYWAMQFLNYVEVLSPLSLREQIKQNLHYAACKYE